jgi:hypothetical protein
MTMTIKAYKIARLGLIKDGKLGATAARSARIIRALAWTKIQGAANN